MRKRTKALQIPVEVKERVWERDGGCCIICGNPQATPSCHYISRGQGGLGIQENIVTLCHKCHHDYDQTVLRDKYRTVIRQYLASQYIGWDESKLFYRKGMY